MLSKLKLFEKDKKPEIFERKQFEFKNIVSPTYIENLVIDEGYFGIKEESTKKEKTIHDDFEDEDFNPFRESARKMSDALVSPNSNQGPTFRGLREFRTSLDGNDPITKNEFGDRDDQMENKHRKFTLSFKENDKKFQGVDESFVKLEEGSSIPFKLDKFKNKEAIIKDQEDYSINAE
mmetsp:Transcript_8153/g.7737  ORF Transcript_8153/g.7737 Transcript_8153/m.7737 type:complete len:178 (+) Transcript_8153:1106-1639(+)